jgi:hypothetical protein
LRNFRDIAAQIVAVRQNFQRGGRESSASMTDMALPGQNGT